MAEKHKFALVGPAAKGDQWYVPKAGQTTSDMNYARKSLEWIKQKLGSGSGKPRRGIRIFLWYSHVRGLRHKHSWYCEDSPSPMAV